MKKISSLLLILLLCWSLSGCVTAETHDSLSSDEATIENPASLMEKVTIEESSGVFSIQLNNTYVGNNATNFLANIGENPKNFVAVDGYKMIVQEYTVSADEGYESGSFGYYPGDMWDTEHKSKYEYLMPELYKNASLDFLNISLRAGESSKMYFVFELPKDVDRYISPINGIHRDFWFTYDVSQ